MPPFFYLHPDSQSKGAALNSWQRTSFLLFPSTSFFHLSGDASSLHPWRSSKILVTIAKLQLEGFIKVPMSEENVYD